MLKLAMFDIGGVLIAYKGSWYREYLSSVSGMGENEFHADIDAGITGMELGSMSLELFEKKIAERLGIATKEVDYVGFFEKNASLNYELLDFVRELHTRVKTAWLSNIDPYRYAAAERMLGEGKGFFDKHYASFAMGVRKPERQIYVSAVEPFAVRYEDVSFVDDLEENVEAAAKLGINAIRYSVFKDTESALEEKIGAMLGRSA
jgi:HAD superfamily hydrolase (TIGR01509 family)